MASGLKCRPDPIDLSSFAILSVVAIDLPLLEATGCARAGAMGFIICSNEVQMVVHPFRRLLRECAVNVDGMATPGSGTLSIK